MADRARSAISENRAELLDLVMWVHEDDGSQNPARAHLDDQVRRCDPRGRWLLASRLQAAWPTVTSVGGDRPRRRAPMRVPLPPRRIHVGRQQQQEAGDDLPEPPARVA